MFHLKQSQTSRKNRPAVILLTEDAANRQKAQTQGIVSMGGKRLLHRANSQSHGRIVRQYVEQMKEDEKKLQLLDLLSAVSDEIEPTLASVAVSGIKSAMYPDVRLIC